MRKLLTSVLAAYAFFAPSHTAESPIVSPERRIVEYMRGYCSDKRETFILYNPSDEKIKVRKKGNRTSVRFDSNDAMPVLNETTHTIFSVHCHVLTVPEYAMIENRDYPEEALQPGEYAATITMKPSSDDLDTSAQLDNLAYIAKNGSNFRYLMVVLEIGPPRLVEYGIAEDYFRHMTGTVSLASGDIEKIVDEYSTARYGRKNISSSVEEKRESFESFAGRLNAGGKFFLRELAY